MTVETIERVTNETSRINQWLANRSFILNATWPTQKQNTLNFDVRDLDLCSSTFWTTCLNRTSQLVACVFLYQHVLAAGLFLKVFKTCVRAGRRKERESEAPKLPDLGTAGSAAGHQTSPRRVRLRSSSRFSRARRQPPVFVLCSFVCLLCFVCFMFVGAVCSANLSHFNFEKSGSFPVHLLLLINKSGDATLSAHMMPNFQVIVSLLMPFRQWAPFFSLTETSESGFSLKIFLSFKARKHC